MAEDKYKTPPKMQEIYDKDKADHETHDTEMKEAAGDPEKIKQAVKKKLHGQEFMDDLISKIEGGFQTVVDTAAKDDPDSYWDDAARTGLSTLQFVGNVASAPGISHGLRLLDSPFWAARQAAGGALEHGLGVDPRYGHAAVGVGEFLAGGKALTKVGKGLKHLDKALDAKDIARRYAVQMNLFNYIDSTSDVPVPRNLTFGEMLSTKNIIQSQSAELLKEATNTNITQTTRMALAKAGQPSGYDVGGWFRYNKFRASSGKMTGDGRPWLSIYQSPTTVGGASKAVPFDNFRFENLPKLREEFAPAIKALGLKPSQFNIHHIAALKASMGIFDGLQYNSPLYKQVSNVLLEELPGLGNMKSNLLPVVGRSQDIGTPHHIVHKFYANKIGESGELFFTDEVLKGMNASKEFRLRKARKLAGIIKESESIVRQAQQVWEDVYSIKAVAKGTGITAFDDFVERLSKFNDEGFIETIGKNYQVPQMRKLIENVEFQRALEPQIPAIKEVYDPQALSALAIAVEDGISAVKALKQAKYGKQLELAIDQITPENLPLLQKVRRGTTPGNIKFPDTENPNLKGLE